MTPTTDLQKLCRQYDIIATISPETMQFAASGELERLRAALLKISNLCPATCDMTLAHQMADIAHATLEGSTL